MGELYNKLTFLQPTNTRIFGFYFSHLRNKNAQLYNFRMKAKSEGTQYD